ncbi:ribonuclease PH [Candidatus Phycosocius bacilliformis]|uniref:Ribonuclease PH n=1 Tax=Candidatus Phycosocius bacilliformis TaxID=1445552 RepID=A0A2P2E7H0_9PROT|nr:ribonuclease PH [Candidatus Phycosocius bacilliformis]GBF56990.1 ribonuclease PH [Candidatus Phycosocius bacilliformis]
MTRPSGRQADQLRTISLEAGVSRYAEGSCLAKFGDTHVLVTASLEESLPGWLRGQKRGWVTAEYGMLPRATHTRGRREAAAGKQSGRTQEIQRLIGRGLRSVVDLVGLGERQITLDCDVIQADGGTRTAALTGAWVALKQACLYLKQEGLITDDPIRAQVAAISCGIYQGSPVLDLDYAEDSHAEADANFVLAQGLGLIEVQATGEERPFTEAELHALLGLAKSGCDQLFALQRQALGL